MEPESEEDNVHEGNPILIPKSTKVKKVTDLFRILTNTNNNKTIPAKHRPPTASLEHTAAFTDGGCTKNGSLQAEAGSGTYFGKDDARNAAYRVPGNTQSNQTGELYAIIKAVEATPTETNLVITIDSKYAIDGLTKNLPKWEDRGWTEINNKEWFCDAIERIRQREGNTVIKWTKGHNNNEGNEEADKLATQGISKTKPDYTQNNPIGRISGIKLANLTQSIVYKALLEEQKSMPTKGTLRNIERIQEEIVDISDLTPKTDAIWKNLKQNKNLYRTHREFIFKTIKNIQKVGEYWAKIPNYEGRANCDTCGQTETMEHILTDCNIPGQNEAWELAKSVWENKYRDWIKPNYGSILGCASTTFQNEDGTTNVGKTRLYQILISETAYLIWTMRCTRVIEHDNDQTKWPSRINIKRQLERKLNLRLKMDCLQTNEIKYKKKAICSRKVKATWSGTIVNEKNLQLDWVMFPGVLVGIRLKYENETLTNR